MRREPVEEGRRWLEQAKEDLKWAEHLAREGGYYLACFLAQQVGEKALKALLHARGEVLVLGHSVDSLAERAALHAGVIQEKRAAWAALDGYYIPTRYPNGLPDSIPARVYNHKLAADAVDLARDIVDTVSTLLFRRHP